MALSIEGGTVRTTDRRCPRCGRDGRQGTRCRRTAGRNDERRSRRAPAFI